MLAGHPYKGGTKFRDLVKHDRLCRHGHGSTVLRADGTHIINIGAN